MTVQRLFLGFALAVLVHLGLCGAVIDELAKEIARRDAEVFKAKQIYDGAVKVADEKALKVYVRLAQRAVKDSDTGSATTAWTEVLRLDRKQTDAVAWFIKLGTLDAVLAELDTPTDLLGNPIGGGASAGTKVGKAVLVFGAGGALVPAGVRTLSDSFAARTTELVVGSVIGDGVIFEEGGSVNGQALGVFGGDIHFMVRAANVSFVLTAPFDRHLPWTQIVAQYNAGVLQLWLNGKLAATGNSVFTVIPSHGGGSLGAGDGSNSAGWAATCQFLLASLRIANRARSSDQVKPNGRMDADADTVLGVIPEAIAAEFRVHAGGTKTPTEPLMLQQLERMPPGNITWTASGMVGVR